MLSDAEIKSEFKLLTMNDPEKYYPIKAIHFLGFRRGKCSNCTKYFWSLDIKRKICGDAVCAGGFTFIGNSPALKKLSYIDIWREFSRIHKELGYTPIKRYPVIARWNPTTEFTIASIAAFQPFVVSGEVEPSANPLVIPQISLRFNDIDNVGVTAAHYTAFVMLGQHAFVAPDKYDMNTYIQHHLTWLTKGMGIPLNEIIIHEDAWAGGGNFGPCMEFFCRGLEISNQVYMQYENTPDGKKDLRIKVLDMGQGMERASWFTQGAVSSYLTTFPETLKKLEASINAHPDEDFLKNFTPHAGKLNVDDSKDLNNAWNEVSSAIKMSIAELREKVEFHSELFSVVEHARALLVAISDGGLPSNVGGMRNLRVLFRRAQRFIDKHNWTVDLCDIANWHADELKELFPELSEHLPTVKIILEQEKLKYRATLDKVSAIVDKVLKKDVTTNILVDLYDSHGIAPDLIKDEAAKRNIFINVPENFYALITARHEHEGEKKASTKKDISLLIPVSVPETKALYFDDWHPPSSFKAKVIFSQDEYVILDQTWFYPTSGGQLHDTGVLDNIKVVDVFKQGHFIVHKLERAGIPLAKTVVGSIDINRREQLMQHHTATHLVNAACHEILGEHINQAGAKKDVDKASLDITHFNALTDEELLKIETVANDLIRRNIFVKKSFFSRREAEDNYGMQIYQGGAVPGKDIRIVNIENVDVEACGGTHANSTSEVELIRILKASKIQDGVVRVVFVAGNAAKQYDFWLKNIVAEVSQLLCCSVEQTPSRVKELFEKWKLVRKKTSRKEAITSADLMLTSVECSSATDRVLVDIFASALQTQPEHIIKTVKRFLEEMKLL